MLEIALDADDDWDSSNGWDALVRGATEAAIAESAFPQLGLTDRAVELSVRLTSDAEVHSLNAQWRGKDKPTNVLSFPMAEPDEIENAALDGPELMLGDIVMAHGVCAAEAMEKNITIDQHATHLLVHGTLHLLGHDHMDDDSAFDMEGRETRALARLGIADPYAGDQ